MTTNSESQAWRRIAGPLFLLRAGGQGLEFIGWVVLARRLGASEFGTVSIAFLLARYAGVLADWGALAGGARDVARDDAHRTRTRALVARRRNITVVLSALYALGCWAIGHLDLAPMISVIAMLGLSRDFMSMAEHRGARAAVPVLVQGGVLLACAVVFAGPGTQALATGCGYAASAVASVLLNRLPHRRPGARDKVALDPWLLGAVLTTQVLSSADTLVLGLLGTAAATGVYSAVYRVPNGWLAGVAILAGALLPVATRADGDARQLLTLRRSSLRVSLISAAVLVAASPLAFVLIPVVFGTEYSGGRWPAVVLLIATAVATGAAPLHQFYLTLGDDRRYAGYLARSAVTIVIASFVFVPMFSMMGAAVATLCAHAVLAASLVRALSPLWPSAAVDHRPEV